MEYITKTQSLLGATEAKLVELASNASACRDYDTAGRILAAAQTIKRIEEQFAPAAPHSISVSNAKTATATSSNGHTSGSPRKSRRLGEYPRFFKSGDRLVKVGWSKTERDEYEHKCPRNVLSYLVSSCLSIGANGKRFSIDEVLPIKNSEDGSEIPAYQIYLAVAWFRTLGLLEQHGRQGYSIRKGINLVAKVEDAWNDLP